MTPVSIAIGKAGKSIKVVRTLATSRLPPGSRLAYVANNGSGTVTAIRVATNTAVKQIKTGAGPDVIAITPNGRTAYVSNHGASTVTAISTVTNKVIKQIKVGPGPSAMAISPNGRTAYVVVGNAVVPIRIATNTALKPVKVRVPPAAIAITPDGKTVWVTGGCTSTSSRVGDRDQDRDEHRRPFAQGGSLPERARDRSLSLREQRARCRAESHRAALLLDVRRYRTLLCDIEPRRQQRVFR